MAQLSDILGPGGFRAAQSASTWLTHALHYAAIGWPVFPVIGKQPLPRSGGVYDGTTDAARLQSLFAAPAITGLALSCGFGLGEGSHLEVVDVDPRNGGDITLDMLLDQHGAMPDTCYQRTGGGGFHYLLAVPDGKRIKMLGKGIDIKRHGGYIVLAPSQHESGRTYDMPLDSSPFEGCPIAPAPAWMIENAAEIVKLNLSGRGYLPPARIMELRQALEHLDADDYHEWVRVGQALHSSESEDAFDLWREWSARSAKYRAGICERKWSSFRAGGGLHIESIFHMARERGASLAHLSVTGTNAIAPTHPDAPRKRLVELVSIAKMKPAQPTQWLIQKHLPEDCYGVLFGPSQAGKSFVMIDMGMHIAAGREWHGRKVRKAGVVYVAGEGANGVMKRVQAWCQHHRVAIEEAADFHISNRSIPLLDGEYVAAFSESLRELVAEIGNIGLIVIDTLNRNFGAGDENKTADMTAFNDACTDLQRLTKAAVMVVHHSSKADSEAARGNGALLAALDVEMQAKRDSTGLVWLNCTKLKDDPKFDGIAFRQEQIVLDIEHEDDEDPTSCVLVPEKDAQAEEEAANRLMNTFRQKLTKRQRLMRQILTDLSTRQKLNNPSIDRAITDLSSLYEAMKNQGIKPSETTDHRDQAIKAGLLRDINGVSYEIVLDY